MTSRFFVTGQNKSKKKVFWYCVEKLSCFIKLASAISGSTHSTVCVRVPSAVFSFTFTIANIQVVQAGRKSECL